MVFPTELFKATLVGSVALQMQVEIFFFDSPLLFSTEPKVYCLNNFLYVFNFTLYLASMIIPLVFKNSTCICFLFHVLIYQPFKGCFSASNLKKKIN